MHYLEVLETLFIKNIVCVMVCPDGKIFCHGSLLRHFFFLPFADQCL